jgi:hypothetical protein
MTRYPTSITSVALGQIEEVLSGVGDGDAQAVRKVNKLMVDETD